MSSLLDQLLTPGAIRIEFQPIVRVHPGHVVLYGVEALARGPRGTSVESADVLFEYARRRGAEANVDMVCIAEAFASYPHLPARTLLSINVHGATLAGTPDFARRVLDGAAAYGIAPDLLMFEVLEHRQPWAIETFLSTLDDLRRAAVRIALDDIGSGASNFRMLVECRPDHLKIDRHIVSGCANDRWRQAALQSIATLGRACGAVPVAEGVETEDELETLIEIGIDTVQGWLYGRSAPPGDRTAFRFFENPRSA